MAAARGHRLGCFAGTRLDRRAELEIDLDPRAREHARVVRKERGTAIPGERGIGVADRDRHDRHTEPLCDAEPSAPEWLDTVPGRRRALGKVEHRDSRDQQVVDPAQDPGARVCVVAIDEHHTEPLRDRTDDRPSLDFPLGDRNRRADRQHREWIEIADVVRDDQRP